MKRISIVLLIIILGLFLTLFGCSKAIASVNGEEISEKDMQRYLDFIIGQDTTGALEEDGEQLEAVQTSILDSLIVVKLLEQYAAENNIEVSAEDIDEEIQQIIASYSSQAEFEQELESRAISEDFLRAEIKDQILRVKIYEQVTEDIEITEQEAREFYEENKEAMFMEPERVKVSHILAQFGTQEGQVEPSESAVQDARDKIEEALRQLEDGKPFEEVAKDLSDDRLSAENGGDLGYISRGEMVEEFEQAAFSLKVGELSDIVETIYGLHLLKVVDRQEEHIKEFEEEKETAIAFLENEEKNQIWTDFIYGLIDEAKIEYHTDIKSTLVPEEGQQ
ncbi:MAG: peptidylprolyl isomerase [Actinomycetota bacterium]